MGKKPNGLCVVLSESKGHRFRQQRPNVEPVRLVESGTLADLRLYRSEMADLQMEEPEDCVTLSRAARELF